MTTDSQPALTLPFESPEEFRKTCDDLESFIRSDDIPTLKLVSYRLLDIVRQYGKADVGVMGLPVEPMTTKLREPAQVGIASLLKEMRGAQGGVPFDP